VEQEQERVDSRSKAAVATEEWGLIPFQSIPSLANFLWWHRTKSV